MKRFKFPGGEVHVEIDDISSSGCMISRLQNSDDIMEMLLIDEIMVRNHIPYNLVIPYIPYARQDRVTSPKEPFSLKMMARLINGMSPKTITTYDCHSPVTNALIDNLTEISQVDILIGFKEIHDTLVKSVLIAPDAGASKKVFNVTRDLGLTMSVAGKIRCTKTGKILHTKTDARPFDGSDTAFIIDDICDGGATFVALASELRKNGFKKVYLYVTHGIFSNGLGVFDGLIDHIFTTDSIPQKEDSRLTVMEVCV